MTLPRLARVLWNYGRDIQTNQPTYIANLLCDGGEPAANRNDRGEIVAEDINVLALVKGEERYLFLFNDSRRADTLRVLGRFASNPELSFTWYDAAVMSQKIRATRKPKTAPTTPPAPNRLNNPSVTDFYGD